VLPYVGGYVGFESGCGFVLTPSINEMVDIH
jgi:hypothetical protein